MVIYWNVFQIAYFSLLSALRVRVSQQRFVKQMYKCREG